MPRKPRHVWTKNRLSYYEHKMLFIAKYLIDFLKQLNKGHEVLHNGF